MPVCTHPHLEGGGQGRVRHDRVRQKGQRERERERQREFDPVARNTIRGDDEADRLRLHFLEECVGSTPTQF